VRILDVGKLKVGKKEVVFFVMPFYPMTFRKVLNEPTGRAERFRIFDEILDGVRAAHQSNVWHRDLKPENILISADLQDVRVADFGIAHFEEAALYSAAETRQGDRLANFQYAAPEQRDRKSAKDHRVDVFALGLMLNEIVTNEVPQGTNYLLMETVDPSLKPIDDLVAQMICRNPADRPPNVETVIQRLAELRK